MKKTITIQDDKIDIFIKTIDNILVVCDNVLVKQGTLTKRPSYKYKSFRIKTG